MVGERHKSHPGYSEEKKDSKHFDFPKSRRRHFKEEHVANSDLTADRHQHQLIPISRIGELGVTGDMGNTTLVREQTKFQPE